MPELPDLVHVEAGLRAALAGKRIAVARTGDPTVLRVMVTQPFPDVLAGRAAGEHRPPRSLHALRARGRSGHRRQRDAGRALQADRRRRRREKAKKDPRSLGLALTFDDAPELQYLDEKRMGKVYVAAAADEAKIPVYGQLGLDVMSPAFTREAFGKVAARRRDQVRAFVMDKRALASVGNAYADEILFAARIHPKTFCNKLDAGGAGRAVHGDRTGAARRHRRDPPARRTDRRQGARLPQGARA